MKIVILGANGFLGSHLANKIANEDHDIVMISRKFTRDFNGFDQQRVRFVEIDFKSTDELVPHLDGADLVYHMISSTIPSSSWKHPIADVNNNLIPSINLFQACVDQGVKKIVFVSSAGTVYGSQTGSLTEASQLQPFSPYGINKAMIENYLQYFNVRYDLNYEVYRVSNVYGPGQNKAGFGVINTWLNNLANGKPIEIYGDPNITKDYIYIDDIIDVFCMKMGEQISQSEIYNLGSGYTYSLQELINQISMVTGLEPKVIRHGGKLSDNKFFELNIEKLKKSLPNMHFTKLAEGISKTWASIR